MLRKTYRVWLEPTLVGQSVSIQSLCLAGSVEEDVGHTHNPIVDDASSSDQVNKPAQDNIGTVADLQEGEAREDHDNGKADKRHTTLCAVAESLGCSALNSQSVQTAGGAESVGVAGTEDGGNQKGADEVRQTRNPHVLHGDDVGRSSSSSGSALLARDDGLQGGINGAKDNTDSEGSSHEEKSKSPVDSLESVLDVDTRASSLSSNHGKVLGTSDTERSRPQSSEETLELAERAGASVLFECVVLPVAETVGIVLGVAADHGDEGEGEDDEDQDDLTAGQPELGFTKDFDCEDVEETNCSSQQTDRQ